MKKTNNLDLSKIIISVVLILFILFLINYIPNTFKKEILTILPIDLEYKEVLPIQGILIKNEKLYFSETNGEVYGIIDEGIRVPVGIEIAQIISLKDMTFYKSELDSIEMLVNQMDTSTLSTAENPTTKDQVIDNLINQIQSNIKNKKYNSLKGLKEKLVYTLDSEEKIRDSGKLEILSHEQLLAKKNLILQEISNYNERLFSRHSGIVSYELDNFEEIMNYLDLDTTSDYIFDSDVNSNLNNESFDKAVFKIINGHEYYIAIKFSKFQASLLTDKDILEVDIKDLDDNKINLKMPIIKKYSRGTEEIIILKSNKFLERIYGYRFLDLDLVTLKKDSFKIPLESIIINGNQQGVFIKSFYDVVVFRPIKINAKDSEFAYVSKGNIDNKIEINDKFYKTINEFSEIIETPNLVVNGQILN